MAAHPIDYEAAPRERRRWGGWIGSQFSRRHAGVALALWLVFSGFTLAIVLRGLRNEPDRLARVAVTTACTALGPMTGAVSRGFQGCCLEFSLRLLPVCLGALVGAVVVQLVVPANRQWLRAARLLAWAGGLFVWFAGGIVSFGHALF